MIHSFYKAISKCNPSRRNISLSVMGGTYKGQKALLTDGSLRLAGEDFGDWVRSHSKDLAGLAGAGILDLDGQRIFYEQLAGKKKLVICGAGHVGLAVARLGLLMQYQVTVIEDRIEFAEAAESALNIGNYGNRAQIVCGSFSEELEKTAGDPDTSFIIVTRGHCNDLKSLKVILRKEHAYVGVMGSRTKTVMIRESLEKEGYPEKVIRQIHMPIGLSIGAQTPEEIAVAIIGEIIQVTGRGKKRYGFPEDILRALAYPKEDVQTSSKSESADRPQNKSGDNLMIQGSGNSAVPCDLAAAEDKVDKPVILATVIRKEGSGPRDVGARMLLYPDGRRLGTVGGGLVEARTIEAAGNIFDVCNNQIRYADEEPEQAQTSGEGIWADVHPGHRHDIKADLAETLTVEINGASLEGGKMVCGGQMEVLLELFDATDNRISFFDNEK